MAGSTGLVVTSADNSNAIPAMLGVASVPTSSTQIAAANPNRKGFRFQNQSSSVTIYLRFGAPAATDYTSIMLPPLAMYESGPHVPLSSINVIATATGASLNAVEWN